MRESGAAVDAENSPQWLARQNAAESRAAPPKAPASVPTRVPMCARPATSDQSPHVHSSLRAGPPVGLARPVPEGRQPQLLGDAGQLAVPSMVRRRAQTRKTTAARTACGGRPLVGIEGREIVTMLLSFCGIPVRTVSVSEVQTPYRSTVNRSSKPPM